METATLKTLWFCFSSDLGNHCHKVLSTEHCNQLSDLMRNWHWCTPKKRSFMQTMLTLCDPTYFSRQVSPYEIRVIEIIEVMFVFIFIVRSVILMWTTLLLWTCFILVLLNLCSLFHLFTGMDWSVSKKKKRTAF